MKKLLTVSLIFSCITASADLVEQEIVLENKAQEARYNPAPGTCGLTRFAVSTQKTDSINPFGSEGVIRSKLMIGVVETSDTSCMTDYVVVQFIKGCVFASAYDRKTGKYSEFMGSSRESRGQSILFKHRKWEVDSTDIDPMYSSAEEGDRFGYLRYFDEPIQSIDVEKIFNSKEETYFLQKRPSYPQYFVSDMPTSSSYDKTREATYNLTEQLAYNTSLQFQTCVYHTKDVPLVSDPKPPGIAESEGGPIKCFNWDHNEVFNHQTLEFETKAEIQPFCLK